MFENEVLNLPGTLQAEEAAFKKYQEKLQQYIENCFKKYFPLPLSLWPILTIIETYQETLEVLRNFQDSLNGNDNTGDDKI